MPAKADAVASVEQSSLLGSNYLGVTFGTPGGPLLKDGDEIKTKATVDMSEVISQLGNLGSKLEQVIGEIGKSMGTGGENGSIFQRVDKLVTDNGPKLTETIANLTTATGRAGFVRRRDRSDSSRRYRRGRNSRSDSSRGTAGDSPRRSRKDRPGRCRS